MVASAQEHQQVLNTGDVVREHCNKLHQLYPNNVLLPNETFYKHAQSSYWSTQQAELQPSCRYQPPDAQGVQSDVRQLVSENISFAVASGGHSSAIGASNIEAGVTIDLSSLSGVELTEDNRAVWLGVGARWADVYAALEPSGLAVSGGRVADVGVGGYVLGGGFSWFANQYGWTCDSVLEFEVVTPDGQLLHVNAGHHKDLFWALKGSLGAFGVVTRIKVPAIRNTAVYGGAMSYRQDQMPALCDALETLGRHAADDLHTQGYISFGWTEKYRSFGTSAYLVNTNGGGPSAAFSAFQEIPHIGSSLREMTLRESAEEIGESNYSGMRRSKFTLTTMCDSGSIRLMHQLCRDAVEATRFDEDGLMGVTFQPLTVSHLQVQSNIFGLLPEDGPLLLVSVELWWSDADADEYFERQAKDLYHALTTAMRRTDALHAFVYPNYAARWQKPFDALALESTQRLVSIRRRYDPDGSWQRLVPGIRHV
ncbi:hypothetical protein LTR85_007317 [Meristemomyces frigidus]|nr:hypothetical protein LTR85_007317 [Meristemomyces frigidus]